MKKDAILVEFDPQAQTKDYLDKKSTYENLVGQVAQKQAEQDIARAKDDTAMKQAEDELRLTIGADQDPLSQALDLELTEKPAPEGELRTSRRGAAPGAPSSA